MADSDNEQDDSTDAVTQLTGFLFGNIDESGQLEDDVLDNECKRHLSSLNKLGFNDLLREVIQGDRRDRPSDSDSDDDLRSDDKRQVSSQDSVSNDQEGSGAVGSQGINDDSKLRL